MATQGERRAETRSRLMGAAAELFAERGVDATSIDAIAERADRTSGAVYDHFGGKDGVLFALLEAWVGDLSAVIGAELSTATTLEERLAVLWRNVSAPVVGDDGRWISLELEFFSYASRHPDAREHLLRRYRGAWRGIVQLAGDTTESEEIGPAIIGLLLGLEMMRRLDPASVTDELAVDALVGVVDATTSRSASRTTGRTASRTAGRTARRSAGTSTSNPKSNTNRTAPVSVHP